jgi:hypothetical protein
MEKFDRCPSCEVLVGFVHSDLCEISRCTLHGEQFYSCSAPDNCFTTKFTGYYPGSEEAIERGWYCYQDANKKWVSCDEQHEGATPDINRVIKELSWNSLAERYT